MEFLKANFWEIKKSSAVRIFGIFLAAAHILTFLDWSLKGNIHLTYAGEATPMCWPVFSNCAWIASWPVSTLAIVNGAFLLFAILTTIALLSSRMAALGWFLMLITTCLKSALYFQDYRLSSNIQYLHFFLLFVWLFIPNKIHSIRFLLVSYFIADGMNKLSPEWLTGTRLQMELNIPVKLAEWLAAISAIIEFVAPIVLFFKDGRYFGIALLTLLTYFGFMISYGGFFEGTLLSLFVCFFALHLFEQRKQEREFIYQSFIRPEPSKIWVYFVVTFFATAQVLYFVPNLPKALTQYQEMYSLHKIKKSNECRETTFLIYENGQKELDPNTFENLSSDKKCDPYMRFLEIKNLCEKMKKETGFKTVSSYFLIRGLKDKAFHRYYEVEDFCKASVTFKSIKGDHNGV